MKTQLQYNGFPGFKLSKHRINADSIENSRKSIPIPRHEAAETKVDSKLEENDDELYLKYLAYRRELRAAPEKPIEQIPTYPEYVLQSSDV